MLPNQSLSQRRRNSFPAALVLVTLVLGGVAAGADVFQATRPTPPPVTGAAEKYIPFPCIDFQELKKETVGGKTRMTFKGTWHNLAPQAVSYRLSTLVMPRNGAKSPLYQVVSVEPAKELRLPVGGQAPFSLTVEASGPVADKYSEMVFLYLFSEDAKNLWKPYLMCAANGYLPVDPGYKIWYPYMADPYGRSVSIVPQDPKIDAKHLIPTRETLGYKDGHYQRNIFEAFNQALATSPKPVINRDGNWSEMAKSGALKGNNDKFGERGRTDNPAGPLARFLGGLRHLPPDDLKRILILMSDEAPFYPVEGSDFPAWSHNKGMDGRGWLGQQPTILPGAWSMRAGFSLLGTYMKFSQSGVMNDQEHFRFLHNVILPIYLAHRGDFRMCGTLAKPIKKGDTHASVTGNPSYGFDPVGEWMIIGSGENAEWRRIGKPAKGGEVDLAVGWGLGGPAEKDHAAGEPWFFFYAPDWYRLELTDMWTYQALAISSRDSAMVEQLLDVMSDLCLSSHIWRDADGSFGREPGSYGGTCTDYAGIFEQVSAMVRTPLPAAQASLIRNTCYIWTQFPFSNGTFPMLNRGGSWGPLPRLMGPYESMTRMFPNDPALPRFARVIEQEKNRKPGSMVDNWSFKIDGWGYAMLRGPGSWDRRMETLLASKRLMRTPGDHTSHECLALCLYAHGANMTHRTGYDWRGYPDFLLNRGRVDAETGEAEASENIWGDFLHFDADKNMPSAVAYTDMCLAWTDKPGAARQERWCVQMPEYLFDAYFMKGRDGKEHLFQWGLHNLGEAAIVSPADAHLQPAKMSDGKPWDPFGYYRKNTSHEGMSFVPPGAWQAEWTMNEGGLSVDEKALPKGSKMRLTMAKEAQTEAIVAWLDGIRRGEEKTLLRMDFVVAKRKGMETCFASACEPIAAGGSPVVKSVETVAVGPQGQRAVKVTTTQGVDWFLVGGLPDFAKDMNQKRQVQKIGPFTTDAALSVVRIRNGQVVSAMMAGGSSLDFASDGAKAQYKADSAGTHHYGGS